MNFVVGSPYILNCVEIGSRVSLYTEFGVEGRIGGFLCVLVVFGSEWSGRGMVKKVWNRFITWFCNIVTILGQNLYNGEQLVKVCTGGMK